MNLRDLSAVVAKSDIGKGDLEVRSNEIRVNEAGDLVVNGKRL